jgi:tetratricopeptide (TPR) repeat protein
MIDGWNGVKRALHGKAPSAARRLALGAALGLALAVAPVAGTIAKEDAEGGAAASHSEYGAYLSARYAERDFAISDAATFFARALADDPNNPELLRRTIYLMAAAGRIDEAATLAERLTKSKREDRLGNLILSVRAAKLGRYKDARARLRPLPERGPNQILLPLLRGWYRYASGDRKGGLKALEPLSKLEGYANFYYLHSGMMLEMMGRTKDAARRYGKALEGGQNPGLRMITAIGLFYERSGRRKQAIKLYESHLKSRPESLTMQLALARAKKGRKPNAFASSPAEAIAEALFDIASPLRQGRTQRQAVIYAQLALHMRPHFAPAQVLIASIYEANRRFAEAAAYYGKVRKSSPLSWDARLSQARLLEDLKRRDEAIKLLQHMADERPHRWDALVLLGEILRSAERFNDAVTVYDRAIARIPKLEPRHWSLLYARGIALERSKHWARAEKDFLKALEFEPDQPHVLNYLGYSWVERGEHLQRARKMIEKAVALRRNDGYITDSLGWVLYRMGKFDEAVKYLERAVELRPQDPTINDHLGDALWMVGRQHEAEFQWRRALSLEPEKDQIPVIESKIEKGLPKPKPSQSN